jgi:hypothetical protein
MSSMVSRIEVRVKQLEDEVRELKSRLDAVSNVPWYRQILGTFADDPVFDEVVRLGREIREAERKPVKGSRARSATKKKGG